MKHSTYTSYDELPLMLSVAEVASVLGISRAGAYELAVGGKAADCQPMWVTVWVRVSSHIRLETCFMKSVSSTESN